MNRLALLLMLVLFPLSASATDPCGAGLRFFARYKGTCINANYFGSDRTESCSGSLYGLERNGSVYADFYIADVGNIYFRGTQKEPAKPNVENNHFNVYRIEILDKQGKTTKVSATGDCSLLRNVIGQTTFTCHATTDHGPLEFRVITTAETPEILDCEEELLEAPAEKPKR